MPTKVITLVSVFLTASLSLALVFATGNVKKMSVLMLSRSVRNGKIVTLKADLFYQMAGGKMVSHYTKPFEQYVLNTSEGEISIYDPVKNTVMQQVNYLYSTETTQFYYFLNNQKADLGLRAMGFINKSIKFEKNLMITTWIAPPRLAKEISLVELVHEGTNPIYTKYVNSKGQTIKKVYYYNYQNVGGLDFPLIVTQIDYFSAKDSSVSKTSYSDIKINEAVSRKLSDFTIPTNAKAIK
ncbi:MAG: hypothetical protein EAZ70_09775 [Runella slithyformis]|nr:MAG: hypothetical protein EAY79_07640 [Runella slithyformis]TAF25641.1 MAG: hypothetical protein EAZ70_09775 [Runella slithyformis]TAF43986.1 MAG: hypothetical protein EAZ63_12890 [Runella slithyformis]TAF79924.1 MAG: hypothetical protein EAZ50_10035 [Runella slithyformis]